MSIPGMALVDTGASISAIDRGVVRPWNLQSVDGVKVSTPDGPGCEVKPIYEVILSIDDLGFCEQVRMVEASLLQGMGVVALIGTDLMDGGLLRYDTRSRRRFTLSFP